MQMRKLVKAILKYQEDKNQFLLKDTGLELIPDSVKIEELQTEDINAIIKKFSSRSSLRVNNCLHCLIRDCDVNCEYDTEFNGCRTVMDPIEEIVGKRQGIVFPEAHKPDWPEIYEIGEVLEKEISDYKERTGWENEK